jgi:hypothetical protein
MVMGAVRTVSRAPHDMYGAISVVSTRSCSLSSVRVAITAGTLQPKPTINGTKDLPGRPTRRISRSTMNAARPM